MTAIAKFAGVVWLQLLRLSPSSELARSLYAARRSSSSSSSSSSRLSLGVILQTLLESAAYDDVFDLLSHIGSQAACLQTLLLLRQLGP